jgi:hypothetical protein
VATACDHDAGMANVLTVALIVKQEVRDFRRSGTCCGPDGGDELLRPASWRVGCGGKGCTHL